jgi:hypothetical protein
MGTSLSREANCSIKFSEFYGIRIQTRQLANCKHPVPNSCSPHFLQLFLMVYLTFVLPLTPRPSKRSSFLSVSSSKLCMHFFQSSVHISRFAYLVVLGVVILVFCRGQKSCSSSPRKLFQSPVTSFLVGPIFSPAPDSLTPSSYYQSFITN